jgi:hypothetical protein
MKGDATSSLVHINFSFPLVNKQCYQSARSRFLQHQLKNLVSSWVYGVFLTYQQNPTTSTLPQKNLDLLHPTTEEI